MLRTLWKFRLFLVLAAVVLVVGGAVAVAAKEGSVSSNQHRASAGAFQHSQEPSETPGTAPSETPGTEPTETDHEEVAGTITSLDCTNGSITIQQEEEGGTFTAQLTNTTVYTVNGQPAACTDLKVGAQVDLEVMHSGTTWTALKVSQGDQDENDQHDGDGDEQGGQATPTPGPGGQATPTPGPGGD